MIFHPTLVEKILAGAKTMTRRPAKPSELRCEDGRMSGCRYRAGKDYAVQRGRGKPAVARIVVDAVELQALEDITPRDAVREGFRTVDRFFDHWDRVNPDAPDRDQLVWVIAFRLVREEPVLLLAKGQGDGHGYTSSPRLALDGEPECVRPSEVDGLNDPQGTLRGLLRDVFAGWEPEDVLGAMPAYKTTQAVRLMRHSMGLRGLDGLPRQSVDERERTLRFMVEAGRSVRDVARAMDCSVGSAQKLIAQVRAGLMAA